MVFLIVNGFISLVLLCSYCKALDAVNMSQSLGTKDFVDEIFKQYGENNATVISQGRFKDLLKQLTLGNVYIEKLEKSCLYKGIHDGYKTAPTKTDPLAKTGDHENRSKRERRSGNHGNGDGAKESRDHSHHLESHISKCLSRKRLLQRHGLNETDLITREAFVRMCPALVQQISGDFCIHRHNCSEKPYYRTIVVDPNMVWAYGFVAITLVSLASLCIIAIIPCLEKGFYERVMGYLVALAVGTLAGDALLHLIPHAFESLLASSEEEHKKNIWKSCFILLGMYTFFLVEQIMRAKDYIKCCKKKKSGVHEHQHQAEKTIRDKGAVYFKDGREKENFTSNKEDESHRGSTECVLPSSGEKSPVVTSDTELLDLPFKTDDKHHDHDPYNHLERHDHHEVHHNLEHDHGIGQDHGHSHGVINKDTSVSTVAWMVIVGDGFHNFSDGLAIGAAFAASYSSGISTAIAVFCHELPHELGDFAVLIKSGMSIRQALCYNLVSAVLSYFGLVIGILVGNYSTDGKQFALALTAGLFLYVALANMLPELTSSVQDDVGDLWTFISPHLGIMTGIIIMLLISIFEDKF